MPQTKQNLMARMKTKKAEPVGSQCHWTGHPFCVYGHRSQSLWCNPHGPARIVGLRTLVWAVVAANVAKYPFFEFGSRYANATGESLIEGYRSMGRNAASWLLHHRHYGEHLLFCHGGHWHCNGLVLGQPLQHLKCQRLGSKCDPFMWPWWSSLISTGRIVSRGQIPARSDSLIKVIAGVLLISTAS